jgi:hypothetical protein
MMVIGAAVDPHLWSFRVSPLAIGSIESAAGRSGSPSGGWSERTGIQRGWNDGVSDSLAAR